MIVKATEDPSRNLELVDSVTRLGVSYHFEEEIDEFMQKLCDNLDEYVMNNADNLHRISLSFRLLRQRGHRASCGMHAYRISVKLIRFLFEKIFQTNPNPTIRRSFSTRTPHNQKTIFNSYSHLKCHFYLYLIILKYTTFLKLGRFMQQEIKTLLIEYSFLFYLYRNVQ